jgi:hypothetical protein
MKKKIITRLLLLSITTIIISSGTLKPTTKGKPTFFVKVRQGGKEIPIINHEITLKKKTFDLIFELTKPMGILLNASFEPQSYNQAKSGVPIDKIRGFEETGMAEGRRNEDLDIIIANPAPSYWYYDDDTENRFNEVSKSGNKIICTRTIKKYFDRDKETDPKEFPITEINNTLYLVFLDFKSNKDYTKKEIYREYLKIKWE